MNKYNFDIIENPEIYICSEDLYINTAKSINKFIDNLSWFESKVGFAKSNKSNLNIRRSNIAKEKINIILNTSDSNDIIDEVLGENKIILSGSKSNIMWFEENIMRIWNILKYEKGDFFDYHTDGKSELNHVGTILLLPPKSFFNYTGGELVLLCDDKEIIINSDENEWFCICIDINIKHKVNKILSGKRVVFKSKLFKNKINKVLWYNNSDIKIDSEITIEYIKKYFNSNIAIK